MKHRMIEDFSWKQIRAKGNLLGNSVDLMLLVAIIFLIVSIARTTLDGAEMDVENLFADSSAAPDVAAAGTVADFRVLISSSTFVVNDADTVLRNSGGSIPVTSLGLILRGVHLNETGQNSAIIEVPGAMEASYAIGDMLLSNVKLVGVFIDRIHIANSGVLEQLYLDGTNPKTVNQ